MKTLATMAINLYQDYISHTIKLIIGIKTICRQRPSCSAYAKQAIQTHGILRGGAKAIKRLSACHPFANS